MKRSVIHSSLFPFLALALILSASARFVRAEVLWDINFKNLTENEPLQETSYQPGTTGPQQVVQDESNKLVGSKGISDISPALLFTKESDTNYTPSFTLKADSAFTSGIITLTYDVAFDTVSPSATSPVETLMAVGFLNGEGGTNYYLVIVGEGASTLIASGSNILKGAERTTFRVGDTAHFKAVLDLNKRTFQAFLNGKELAPEEQDDSKFNSFIGITVRDGTALGGNHGAVYSAGVGNLKVTYDQ